MAFEERELFAVLRRLSLRGAIARMGTDGYRLFSRSASARGAPIEDFLVREMLARGLAEQAGDAIMVSPAGRSALRRRLVAGTDEEFAQQHRTTEKAIVEHDSGRQTVSLNTEESPLAWLRKRKGRDGRPMLDAAQFQAGERLRADFTRGQMIPRVTANWDVSVAAGRRGGDSGLTDLTDAALAARLRVEKAIDAVGPELGGVLLDFCCFLTGIEQIERTRRWPARSAKLVLRLALNSLARHYGFSSAATGAQRSRIRHWGTKDYRPEI
jgi:hypothetical protein